MLSKKPYNPYALCLGGERDRYEETTDGFRYETFRVYGNANHKARLRRALNNDEPYLWQIIIENHKVHYFHTYKEAMSFLGYNGYLPKPKRFNNLYM